MSNEIEKLLQELRAIQSTGKNIPNTKEIWSLIGEGKWKDAGFESEDELKQFINDNPYSNLV
jgi:hypothetical protein